MRIFGDQLELWENEPPTPIALLHLEAICRHGAATVTWHSSRVDIRSKCSCFNNLLKDGHSELVYELAVTDLTAQ